ncbi:MAG TPA: hypothetical protein VEN95_07640 [Actinomycetota bacterium]|nr:hypothetical protein [Actinomycetota bacterium]
MTSVVKWLLAAVVGPFLFLLSVYALVGGIVGLAGAGEGGDCKCEAPAAAGLGWDKFGLIGLGVVLILGAYFAVALAARPKERGV